MPAQALNGRHVLWNHAWNGISLLKSVTIKSPKITVTLDASGSWGCGAFCDPGAYISIKKMVPVVIAVTIWGRLGKATQLKSYLIMPHWW